MISNITPNISKLIAKKASRGSRYRLINGVVSQLSLQLGSIGWHSMQTQASSLNDTIVPSKGLKYQHANITCFSITKLNPSRMIGISSIRIIFNLFPFHDQFFLNSLSKYSFNPVSHFIFSTCFTLLKKFTIFWS